MYEKIDYSSDPRLSIINSAQKCGLQLVKPGIKEQIYICPFCEDDRGHLFANIIKNQWKCHKCGERGTAITLYARMYGIDNKEAFKRLIADSNINKDEIIKIKKESQKNIESNEANITVKDKVYNAFLDSLILNDSHFENLLRRGLTFNVIRENKYKSLLPNNNSRRLICKRLLERGYKLDGVPGFYVDETEEWNFMHINTGGILIPSRDVYGRIQGMQVRLDGAIKRRYRNFSSADMNKGTGTHNYIHVRYGSNAKNQKIVITEGLLKADVASYLSDTTFVGIVGTNAISGLIEVVSKVIPNNKDDIFLALDMDKLSNEYVLNAEKNIVELFKSNSINLKISSWNKEYKGIDDYLLYLKQKKAQAQAI